MANTNKVTLDQLEMSMNVVKKYIDSVATSESAVVFEDVTEGEIMTSVEETISCTGITLSSDTLSLNGLTSQTLVATIEPSDCNEEVSWSVSPSGVVTVEDGIVTSVANGDCVITVTCGSCSATCNVNVSGIVVLGNLVVNKTSISIEEGASETFEITLDSQPNTEQTVTISVDNDNVTVNPSSLTFTSDDYNVAQVVTVTATDNSDVGDINSSVVTISSDGVSSKTVNVIVTDNDGVSCTGISLDQTSLSFTEDYSAQLTATVTPTNTTDTITWSVSPSGVVTVEDGLITPVANGDAVITVTCGNQSATCSVNVSCFVETYTVTNNLTNVTTDNDASVVNGGSSYSATLTTEDGYEISSYSVTMNGEDITSTAYSNGVISITSVTGDIVITAVAKIPSTNNVAMEVLSTDEGVEYYQINDVSLLTTGFTSFVNTSANAYSSDTYNLYLITPTSAGVNLDATDSELFMDTFEVFTGSFANFKNYEATTTKIVACYTGSAWAIRVPVSYEGTSHEYLIENLDCLKIKKYDCNEFVIDPTLITSISIKDGVGQYAQFGYSSLPSANILRGLNTFSVATGSSANLSGFTPPRTAVSTSVLSVTFPLETFEEFTLENVKAYFTEKPLIFYYA